MSTDFDPIKALREEIGGLVEINHAIQTRERKAERDMGEAEAELNALRKLTGFAAAELDRKRQVLRKLEADKEKEEKGQ